MNEVFGNEHRHTYTFADFPYFFLLYPSFIWLIQLKARSALASANGKNIVVFIIPRKCYNSEIVQFLLDLEVQGILQQQ